MSKNSLFAGLLETTLPSIFLIAVSKPSAVFDVVFSELEGKVIWLAETEPAPIIPNW